MVQLRFYTYTTDSKEKETKWTFEPLKDEIYRLHDREQERASQGRLRRRPYAEQEVHAITLGAGLLRVTDNKNAFRTLLRAHRIEMMRIRGGKQTWLEYDLDIEPELQAELLEDVVELKRYKIKLVQSDPLLHIDFENKHLQIAS